MWQVLLPGAIKNEKDRQGNKRFIVHTRGVATGVGGVFKNPGNSGKLRENSVTSGNICGC